MNYNKSFESFLGTRKENVTPNKSSAKKEKQPQVEVVIEVATTSVEKDDNSEEDMFGDDVVQETSLEILKLPECISSNVDEAGELSHIQFEDIPETSVKMCKLIHHPLKYPVPFMSNPNYRHLTWRKRMRMLNVYFQRLGRLSAKAAKKSLKYASLPKPILASVKCKNTLSQKDKVEEDILEKIFLGQPLGDQVYISRAGRQVKRKVYTEEFENDHSSDVDETLLSSINNNKKLKITTDLFENSASGSGIQATITKVKPKTYGSRTSLLSTNKTPLSRTDAMFNKLLSDNEKKKQLNKELDVFKYTLTNSDDDSEDDLPVKATSSTPIVMETTNLKNNKTSNGSFIDKTPKRASTGIRSLKSQANSSSPSTSDRRKSNVEMTPCPICDKKFAADKIENHASNCGLDEEEEASPSQSDYAKVPKASRICEVCKNEFQAEANYKAHVQKCVASIIDSI